MKTKMLVSVVIPILILGALGFFWYQSEKDGQQSIMVINTFQECAAAGYPIMESYPRQCRTPDKKLFVEVIEAPKPIEEKIVVGNIVAGQVIKSPLTIKGKAVGNWFFEASFPIRLYDASGKELAVAVAQADGEWMTTEFVPFTATLTFKAPAGATKGTLVFQKDNPSGLPQYDDSISVPILFTKEIVGACKVGGCSGEICSDQDMMSACIFKPEFACYKTATCKRQASGNCGWTDTAELRSCVNSY